MSDTFDPYHEWLGIPKQEQPASAYRLLGIREFEHDGAVIANAADRTMKHLRTYQAGKRARISQMLLNEVANAKITLLDEKSKSQYDAELAVEFQASKKSLEETVTPPPQINKDTFVEDHTKAIESIAKGNQSSRGRRQRRGNKAATQSVQSRFLFIGIIVFMILIAIGIAWKPKAEREAKEQAERIAKIEAKRKAKSEREAKEQAERIAKIEAEQKAKAKRKAEEEAERKTKVEYWPNGKKKSESHWKNDKQDGLATYWHENGQKKAEGHLKNGKPDGLWTRWYENGQKYSEIHYKNGKKDGLDTWWYNGQKQESHYKNGKLDGLKTLWLTSDRILSETNYKLGRQDGLETSWWGNGKKRSEYHYKNGKQDGLQTRWYDNGQKKEETDRKNGKLISASSWKSDGSPCPITKVVDGSGIFVVYHKNGQKAYEEHYKDGKQDGLATWWYENGKKREETHWKNGIEISRKEF